MPKSIAALEREIAALKPRVAEYQSRRTVPDDRSQWDWFAKSCPCGLPPGDCKVHHRARASQRPPEGEWNKHLFLAGRGTGKTRSGAQWVKMMIETGKARRIALVGPTAADARDTMVLGESGLMAVCPPWNRPVYIPSLGRLTWPNGAIALTYSAERPDRLRGPNFDAAWLDEVAAWDRAQECYDMVSFATRIGDNPQFFISTTPRATKFIKGLIADKGVNVQKASTYENRVHLAPAFFTAILTKYEGTRLGDQEINADVLDISEAAWFQSFSEQRNVTEQAEYTYGHPVFVAVDAGLSRWTGGIWAQCFDARGGRKVITVFQDFLAVDKVSAECAEEIKALGEASPCEGLIERVLLDPMATARTAAGVAARSEYERIFGSRLVDAWPLHKVADGLEQLELAIGSPKRRPELFIHPRCTRLIDALKSYKRAEKRGEILDVPLDPQHPQEDLVDSLRGFVRHCLPEGHRPQNPNTRWVPYNSVF